MVATVTRVSTFVVAVSDLDRAVAFWSQALGYRPADEPTAGTVLVDPAGRGPSIDLRVGSPGAADSEPMHLDLYADQPGKHVERLVDLGATVVDRPRQEDPDSIALADPDGNVFCVVPHDPADR